MVVIVVVVLVLGGFFVASLLLRRHGEAVTPAGHWSPTDELFVDPGTGRRMRVWVDTIDASRHYVPEGESPGHA
ncbi:MAG: hypothetical protein ACYDB7_11850 [Mycobacteriales bacterium]